MVVTLDDCVLPVEVLGGLAAADALAVVGAPVVTDALAESLGELLVVVELAGVFDVVELDDPDVVELVVVEVDELDVVVELGGALLVAVELDELDVVDELVGEPLDVLTVDDGALLVEVSDGLAAADALAVAETPFAPDTVSAPFAVSVVVVPVGLELAVVCSFSSSLACVCASSLAAA